jgi:PII-like signaling protein
VGGEQVKGGSVRILDGVQVLARVFVGESDKWHHQPLHRALLERLRAEGFAGATVFRGIAGFGAHSVIHTSHVLDLSADLPVIVEVVDTEEQMEKLLPILDEMVQQGVLVTMEKVRVVRYGCAPKPPTPSAAGAA